MARFSDFYSIKKISLLKNYCFVLFLCLISLCSAKAQYITTIAGNDSCARTGDGGIAINAKLAQPSGLCMDKAGNLYVNEFNSGIRKITATDTITTIAGGGPITATGDGIPAIGAFLHNPDGICLDTAGNLLFADGYSRIRKVDLVTGIITTMAGTITAGYSGDGGPATAAQLFEPVGIAVDSANNIYISEYFNSVIRKVDAATGIISTIAGNHLSLSYSGDGGPATAATLNKSWGLYVDKKGNVYIADSYNNRVRMINAATGIIYTIAGNGTYGSGGDGGPATSAELDDPRRVTMDKWGNIFIDTWYAGGGRVRRIDASTGIISTYAGNGTGGAYLDTADNGGPATNAPMEPLGMCFDTCNNLFLASGCLIRVISPTPLIDGRLCYGGISSALSVQATASVSGIQVYPNPNNGSFTIKISSNTTEPARIIIADVLGQKVNEITATTNQSENIQLNAPPGIYFVNVVTAGERRSERVITYLPAGR